MYSIYQLYCMNHMKTPFSIKRGTWKNLVISVDIVRNFHYSAGDWRCDALTKDTKYYGAIDSEGGDGQLKMIDNGGSYCWMFSNQVHDESLIKPYREYNRPQSHKGLTIQTAGKNYICRYCQKSIDKGVQYERYAMRYAGRLNAINEVFCLGCRDKMREAIFKKDSKDILFSELQDKWAQGILV